MGDDKDDNNKEESSTSGDNDNDNNENSILSIIAESTYFKSSSNYSGDDEDDDSVEFLPLADSMQSSTQPSNDETKNKSAKRKHRSKKLLQKLRNRRAQNLPFPSLTPKSSPPLRAILLALSLALILAAFWILDSLKDPMFAILVEGELGKHQPRAKMVSVGMTLILVCTVEFVSNERRKKRKLEEERRKKDEDVLDGGGNWTKMNIGTSYENPIQMEEQKLEKDDAAIPVGIFTTLGLGYAILFAAAAYSLSQHSSFVLGEVEEITTPSSAWRTLGYALYAAVESYGSLTVAAFWSFSNSNLTLATAEENYGLIIAAAQLGAIGGSTIVAMARSGTSSSTMKHKWYEWDYWSFKHQWSVPSLVWLGCGIMVLQVLLMRLYGSLFPVPMHEEVDGKTEEDEYRPVVSKPDAASSHHPHSSMHDVSICASSTAGSVRSKSSKHKQSIVRKGKEQDGLGAFMSGVLIILRYNYVLLILGVSCLFEVSLTCLDYEMKLIGWDKYGSSGNDVVVSELPSPHISAGETSEFEGGIATEGFYDNSSGSEGYGGSTGEENSTTFAQFMGHYGQMTNALSLLLSYFAFPYLMTKFGLRRTLRLFPTLLVFVTVLTYLAVPFNLPVLFISMSLLKAMTYSINDPAKELLYMPTSNTVKFKAKFWIDVVGARIAKAIGSSINNYAGSVERIVRYGTVPSLVTAIMLYMACLKAGEQFESLIQRGEIVGWEEDEDNGTNEEILFLDDTEEEEEHGDNDDDVYEKEGMVDHCTYDLDHEEEDDIGWESNTTIELVKR